MVWWILSRHQTMRRKSSAAKCMTSSSSTNWMVNSGQHCALYHQTAQDSTSLFLALMLGSVILHGVADDIASSAHDAREHVRTSLCDGVASIVAGALFPCAGETGNPASLSWGEPTR